MAWEASQTGRPLCHRRCHPRSMRGATKERCQTSLGQAAQASDADCKTHCAAQVPARSLATLTGCAPPGRHASLQSKVSQRKLLCPRGEGSAPMAAHFGLRETLVDPNGMLDDSRGRGAEPQRGPECRFRQVFTSQRQHGSRWRPFAACALPLRQQHKKCLSFRLGTSRQN